jgi:hypothetical protein
MRTDADSSTPLDDCCPTGVTSESAFVSLVLFTKCEGRDIVRAIRHEPRHHASYVEERFRREVERVDGADVQRERPRKSRLIVGADVEPCRPVRLTTSQMCAELRLHAIAGQRLIVPLKQR